jgi:hypothetical protein
VKNTKDEHTKKKIQSVTIMHVGRHFYIKLKQQKLGHPQGSGTLI